MIRDTLLMPNDTSSNRPPSPTVKPHATSRVGRMAECDALAVARQRRAEQVKLLVAAWLRRCSHPYAVLAAVAVVLAGVTLASVNELVWSPGSFPASVPSAVAILLAATISSIAGFAFSAICGVVLLHMMSNPVEVVEIMMVCSIAIQSLSVAVLWRDIDWRILRRFVAGGIVGLPIGVWLLLHFGDAWFKEAVGGLLIVYAAYRLLERPLVIRSDSRLADACIGFVGGITGGFAGFPGASVTIWCGMKHWDKRRQRALYQPYILIMQVMALMLVQLMHPTTTQGADLGRYLVQFVPAALLGTWFGLAIFRHLSDRRFAQTVNLLLFVSGVGLLV